MNERKFISVQVWDVGMLWSIVGFWINLKIIRCTSFAGNQMCMRRWIEILLHGHIWKFFIRYRISCWSYIKWNGLMSHNDRWHTLALYGRDQIKHYDICFHFIHEWVIDDALKWTCERDIDKRHIHEWA